MATVVSLRAHRKKKARQDKAATAAANRAAHGRPKAAKVTEAAARTLQERRLDGHRLSPDTGETERSGDPTATD
ncbi:MAG: DUF4169 family protein [Rhodospirillaceae bacterium]|nr:DUF4169 family protein [Rhodospirillaceae bacterium]